MGRQVFRGITLTGCRQNKVVTDRTTQSIGIGIRQNAVLQTRGEQHQQTRLWAEIPMVTVQGVLVCDGATITSSQA